MTVFYLIKLSFNYTRCFLQIFRMKNKLQDTAGQSPRLQQVPYGWRKLKLQKKDYFTKSLLSPTGFKINTSNLQEMFLDIFKNFCNKSLLKTIKSLNKTNCFFLFVFYIYIFKFFKNSFQQKFLNISRNIS